MDEQPQKLDGRNWRKMDEAERNAYFERLQKIKILKRVNREYREERQLILARERFAKQEAQWPLISHFNDTLKKAFASYDEFREVPVGQVYTLLGKPHMFTRHAFNALMREHGFEQCLVRVSNKVRRVWRLPHDMPTKKAAEN